MAEKNSEPASGEWLELAAVLLLSVTAILTAWTGFQSSKWGGAMSTSFAQASTARIEAARFDGDANRKQTIQVSLFTQWLQAYQAHDSQLTSFLEQRFPEPLASAFPVWVAEHPLKNPNAAPTPFQVKEYAIPELKASQEADARADAKYQEALRDNQRGDNYTLLTVAFASVLFFTAMAARMRDPRIQWVLLAIAVLGFVTTSVFLATFPKLV
ncbi:MAG: hypothetical protein QOK15_1610 [Nocardioidaceae bacterium]|nr:hypothetical protein [Nocardioidaceae bacterium]